MVPDQALRKNLQDALVEDFVSVYRVALYIPPSPLIVLTPRPWTAGQRYLSDQISSLADSFFAVLLVVLLLASKLLKACILAILAFSR